MHYHQRGEWRGGVLGYEADAKWWIAYVNLRDGASEERRFGRRRDAKRWVEARVAQVWK